MRSADYVDIAYQGASVEAIADELANPFNTRGPFIKADAVLSHLSAYLRTNAAHGRWLVTEPRPRGRPRRRRYNHGGGGRPRGSGAYTTDAQAGQAIYEAYQAAGNKLKWEREPNKADVAHQLGCSRGGLYWYLRRFNVGWPPDQPAET